MSKKPTEIEIMSRLLCYDTFTDLYRKEWSSDADTSEFLELLARYTHDEQIIDSILNGKPGFAGSNQEKNWNECRSDFMSRYVEVVGLEALPDRNICKYHSLNGKGYATSVIDYEIVQDIISIYHVLMVNDIPYLYENGAYRPDESGVILKDAIREMIEKYLIKSTTINRVYNLLLTYRDISVTLSEMNNFPPEWVCFKNCMYDPVSDRIIKHSPKYRAINMIPHNYRKILAPMLPSGNIEKWLQHIAPVTDTREMFLQFLGVCMSTSVDQQYSLFLIGEGDTGKSTIVNVIERTIGEKNKTSVSLKQLSERFFSYQLVGKLLSVNSDLKTSELEDASNFKLLTSGDSMQAERKGHDSFSFRNYAKFIFCTNSLPTVKGEYTNGFYRRLLVIRMFTVPDKISGFERMLFEEIEYLICITMDALHRLYSTDSRKIIPSEDSVKAVESVKFASDPAALWLHERCRLDPKAVSRKVDLYDSFRQFCSEEDLKFKSKNDFYKIMTDKGFTARQTTVNGKNDRYIFGIEIL